MAKLRIKILLFIVLFFSCEVVKSQMGQIKEVTYYSDSLTNEFKIFIYQTPNNIWFKDSLVILEVRSANTQEDEYGNVRSSDSIIKYVFFNMRKNEFHEFRFFSDTGLFIESYSLKEEGLHPTFFRFYREHLDNDAERIIPSVGSFISDTLIKSVSYSRYQFYASKDILPEKIDDNNRYSITLYFNCNSNKLFGFFKQLKIKPDCPITRYEENYRGVKLLHEIEIVSNNLTLEQIKVFDAWELYAKLHPVKSSQ
jgi:hypothetical protein